jgi:hypothetical protein
MADIPSWVLGAVTIALGSALSLGVEAVRRQWAKKDSADNFIRGMEAEKRQRVEQRTEAAAEKLVELFETVWKQFLRPYALGETAKVPDAAMNLIRRYTTHVGDADARKRLEQLALVMQQSGAVESFHGERRATVIRLATRAGVETAGAVLRGEPVPQAPTELPAYLQAIDEYWAAMDESQAR